MYTSVTKAVQVSTLAYPTKDREPFVQGSDLCKASAAEPSDARHNAFVQKSSHWSLIFV